MNRFVSLTRKRTIKAPEGAAAATSRRNGAGAAFRAIGRIVAGPPRVILDGEATDAPMTSFARDELARFFDSAIDAGGVD